MMIRAARLEGDIPTSPNTTYLPTYANDALAWAYSNGIMEIKDAGNAEEEITREEAAYIAWNIFSKNETVNPSLIMAFDSSDTISPDPEGRRTKWQKNNSYVDQSDIDTKYYDAVFQMYMNNVMTGSYVGESKKMEFRPKDKLLREEICKIVTLCVYD